MPNPALILDFGNVLYKPVKGYEEELRRAAATLLRRLGADATPETVEQVLETWRISLDVQQGIRYAAALLLSKHGLAPSPARVEALASLLKSVIVSNAILAEGAYELLTWAHSRGIPVAILSNNWCYECILELLARDDILHLVDAVVSSDQIGYCKPRPEIYHATLILVNADPEKTLFIDDQPAYVEGARKAGIRHAMVHDGRPLTHYIPMLEEILGTD